MIALAITLSLLMSTATELARDAWQAELKLYLENDAGAWVDFSDRYTNDRLRSIGSIDYLSEGDYQQPVMKGLEVKLNNNDRHFDADTLLAGFSAYLGKRAKLSVKVAGGSEENLGVFLVPKRNAIHTDLSSVATLKLDPLVRKLEMADADTFKNGAQRYENRPWLFGVRELLRSEFGNASGVLPGSYVFPSDARYDFADGAKHFSEFGKPPQWDGTDWNEDNAALPRTLDFDAATSKLFAGVGKDLWEYDIATDTWTNRGEDSPGAGTEIRSLFVCDDLVVCCKWVDSPTSVYQSTLYVNCWDRIAGNWHATTRTSYTDFFSGVFWIYNGVYDAAWGTGFRVRGYFNFEPDHGSNVHVPFEQRITGNQTGGGTAQRTVSTAPTASANSSGPWLDLPRNLYEDSFNAFRGSSANTNELQVRVAYGNKPNLAFDRVDGSPDAYLYMVFGGSTNPVYNIRRLSITRGSAITGTTVILTGNGFDDQKHSLTLEKDKARLTWIRFTEKTDTTGYDSTQLMGADISGGLGVAEIQYIGNTLFADPTDLIVDILMFDNSSVQKFIFIKSNPEWVGTFPSYEVWAHDNTGGGSGTFTVLDTSSSYFVASRTAPLAFPVVYIDGGTGATKKLSDFTSAPVLIDGGRSPVFDAPFAMDFRYGTGSDPDIWGLSAPSYNPDTQEVTPDGKYYLWSYNTKASGRVSLMDFEGMNKWEAIAALCDRAHHRIYVDRSGDFIVEPRNPSALGSDEVDVERYLDGWSDIQRDGETEIQNYIEVTPYVSRLAEMETVLHLRQSSSWDGDVVGTQMDRLERQVQLRCIKGGKISDGITRWAWRPYYSTVKSRLGAAYSGGTSVTVESAKDMEVGDGLVIRGSAERAITAISGVTITIASAFSGTYPILSDATCRKVRQGKWSSEGVTQLAEALDASETGVDVDSVSDLAVGVRIRVDGEEMPITAISGNTLTVTRGSNATSHADNAIVRAVLAATSTDTHYAVGGQQIMVRWKPGPTEKTFRVGDFIEFTCAGLKLEKQKEALVEYIDDTSVATYGKSQMRHRVDNRFMDFNAAERKAKDVGTRGANPHKKYNVTRSLHLGYFLFDSFYLKSPAFFPDKSQNRARVIVRGISYVNGRTVYATEAE